MDDKFRFYAAAFVILRDGNKILLARRCNTGHQDGKYGLVSGHLDGNETAQQAIIREAKEEVGVTLNEKDLRVIHVFHNQSGDREYFNIMLEAEKWGGEVQNLEPDKCDDLQWFDRDALPENIIPYMKTVLRRIDDGFFYTNVDKNANVI